MTINKQQVKQSLQDFDFVKLFTQELGWDHHNATLPIPINDKTYTLTAVAEKREMVAYVLEDDIPDYSIRRKIERQVTKTSYEHIIIYIDKNHTTQIWQWVKRETGKPLACREHPFYKGQSGEALVQRLEPLAVSLEEEEQLTILDVTTRARAAFDVDRVTKRFYDLFKNEHKDFLDFIRGIPDDEMQRWYASVMLNRLMFVYFIQKEGFLDKNQNYLKDKLDLFKSEGKDNYYIKFLCPLFFSGFALKESERSDKTNKLLGQVPYLNGGIFQKHQIEQLHGKTITIPDKAFEALFNFFEGYQWHLDERPLRKDDEINPDVLGYIFEKYINQKQMGAYYTKEDITGYISKNTIIPFILDSARKKCKIAFEGEQSVWNLLRDDPDRYIYQAVKHGIENELPKDIADGIDDISKRTTWNTLASETHALPTEIWREVVARRQRYEELHTKLENREITEINDLITYNLDITQFAQDVVENCEGPELLLAIWKAIEKITVLDPTCGSGAFLFAALNILEPLYEGCLDRMQMFLDELERSEAKHHPDKYSDFRKMLSKIDKHPNRRYFILKSIILNNLYGVDIMDEAVEICKLRLFLKMVAQIEEYHQIEPLPDIDFNIRAGNTLVGYASFDEVEKAAQSDLLRQQELPKIREKAELAAKTFDLFHKLQTEKDSKASEYTDAKVQLNDRLAGLELELNKFLADEYYAKTSSHPKKLESWIKSHKPFHWCIDYYSIINDGGFDVVIGNPPYVEYSKIKSEYSLKDYETIACGNLYAYVLERSLKLMKNSGRAGMIVPLSSVSTPRMSPLTDYYKANNYKSWLSFYAGDSNPGQLFSGVKSQLSIHLLTNSSLSFFTTNYMRWFDGARQNLFPLITYVDSTNYIISGGVAKVSSPLELQILSKVRSKHTSISQYFTRSGTKSFYFRNASGSYYRLFCLEPPFIKINGKSVHSTTLQKRYTSIDPRSVVAPLSSNLFNWFWVVYSDNYHITAKELNEFRFAQEELSKDHIAELTKLCTELMKDYGKHSSIRIELNKRNKEKREVQIFEPRKSKSIMNNIDESLLRYYDFSEDELDFIISYDIKYRIGITNSEHCE